MRARDASGKSCVIPCAALVLATGGVGKAFKITSNSWEYTGDGHALAMRYGSTLVNMEFGQVNTFGGSNMGTEHPDATVSGTIVLTRVMGLVPVVVGVATAVFLLIHLIPGDPVQAMLAQHQVEHGHRDVGDGRHIDEHAQQHQQQHRRHVEGHR